MPANIENKNNLGTHWLIQNGAKLVTCVEDILCEYGIVVGVAAHSDHARHCAIFEKGTCGQVPLQNILIPDEYKPIYNILSKEPVHIDVISRKLNLKPRKCEFYINNVRTRWINKTIARKNVCKGRINKCIKNM